MNRGSIRKVKNKQDLNYYLFTIQQIDDHNIVEHFNTLDEMRAYIHGYLTAKTYFLGKK